MSLSAEEGMPSRGLPGVLEQQEIKTQPAQVTQVESLRKTYRIWDCVFPPIGERRLVSTQILLE